MEWRAFELHPELPPEGGTLGYPPERTRAFRQHIEAMAAEAGLPIRFRDTIPNSRLALEAAEHARAHGKLRAFHRGVFDAYFRDAENIGNVAVLARLAEQSGLDPAALRQDLEQRTYAEAVEYQIEFCKQANILAVPSFVFDNKYLVQGCQPYDVFKGVMEEHVLPGRTPEG